MTQPTPSSRRYEKTRQGILDAARAILLEQGVQAISMRTLAEKVDYSPAALYKYFSNKEEIIEALRQEAWALLAAHEPEVEPGMSLGEIFIQSGRSYVDFATRYPEYYLLMMSTVEGGPASLAAFKQDPNFLSLLQFMEAAVAAGEFKVPDGYTTFHMTLLSWFSVHAVALLKLTMMSQCADEFEATSLEVFQMICGFFSAK
ncbi:MAG: TetR/AcrR family transcriptional regulator [Chloroflexota bacterium]